MGHFILSVTEEIWKVNKRVFGVFFIVIMLIISGIAVMPNKNASKGEARVRVNWNGSKEYPLADARNTNTVKPDGLFEELLNKLKTKVTKKEEKLQNKITEDHPYRMNAILFKNQFQKRLGMDMTTSYDSGDNLQTDFFDKVVPVNSTNTSLGGVIDDMPVSDRAESIAEFSEYAKNKGINFLYFHHPGKYGSNAVYKDYSVKKVAEIRQILNDRNVDSVFFDDYMPKDKDEYVKMFYKTDHHWLPSTGLIADKVLSEHLHDKYGYSIDTSYFDIDKYDIKTADQPFLGTWGQRVTEVYISPEPFEIYYPKYHTDLTVYNSRYDETKTGTIADTLYDYSLFEGGLYDESKYHMYGLGNIAYCSIHNNDIHDGSHVLMLSTSFAYVMFPYLSTAFEDIDVIDLRYFNGSIKSFIEDKKPDTIILVYGTASYVRDGRERTFDFR